MATDLPFPQDDERLGLQQQVVRLQALLEVSRQVHSTVDEQEVLECVLRIAVRELEMECAAFPGAGLAYPEPLPPGCDCAALPSFPLEDRDGNPMAELVVAAPEGRELSLYELDFLEGLALQASVALENARNHKRNLEYVRVQQDLDAARAIQRSLLPQQLPQVEGFTIAFRSDACYEVGGDYLDLVIQPDGQILMVVADVAGKGMASAIVSTGFRAAFRAMASRPKPLDEMAERMNRQHWAEGEESRRRYVTAIFVRLDPEIGAIEVVNAGHNPAFLLTQGEEPRLFEASGTPLGLLPDVSYTVERCVLPSQAQMLLYTDGLTEVYSGDEEFGPERLLETLSLHPSSCASGMLDALWAAIEAFSSGSSQRDDMTALALCRAIGPQQQSTATTFPESTYPEMRA